MRRGPGDRWVRRSPLELSCTSFDRENRHPACSSTGGTPVLPGMKGGKGVEIGKEFDRSATINLTLMEGRKMEFREGRTGKTDIGKIEDKAVWGARSKQQKIWRRKWTYRA
jgi:hypothetical protein